MSYEDKKFVVYVAINIANGHRYVGFTSIGLEKRKKQHIARSKRDKSCPKFHNALLKYGYDSFNWRVVATFNTASEALAEEIRLIAELDPEYNITAGGEGTLGVPSRNRKSVTCLNDGNMFVSVTHAAKFYNLNTATVYEICSGKYRKAKNLYFIFGDKIYSEIERLDLIKKIEKVSAQRRKRVAVNKNYGGVKFGKDAKGRSAAGPMKVSRKVLCLDDAKVYPSASEAGRHYNISKSSIIELCLGKNNRETVGGLRFKYEGAK